LEGRVSKGAQIVLGATAVALLLGWYAFTRIEGGAFTYYQTLAEFRDHGSTGDAVRVHGYVAEHSIERDVDAKVVRFSVQEAAPHAGGTAEGAMPVVYASLETPDLFKEGAEVVVEGQLDRDGRFLATNVLAKCPSKFEAAQEAPARGPGAPRPSAG
jgi:cytochrome c-type biogenesis protein CcmE